MYIKEKKLVESERLKNMQESKERRWGVDYLIYTRKQVLS